MIRSHSQHQLSGNSIGHSPFWLALVSTLVALTLAILILMAVSHAQLNHHTAPTSPLVTPYQTISQNSSGTSTTATMKSQYPEAGGFRP